MNYPRVLLITITLLSLFLPLLFAQAQSPTQQLRSWVSRLGAWMILIWLIGGLCVFLGVFLPIGPKSKKGLILFGILFILIGDFLIKIAYVAPLLEKQVISFKACEEAFPETITQPTLPDPVADFVVMTSCILTGYAPTALSWLEIPVFFIFGIILPLAILFALFWEYSAMLENENVRRVITFASALIAFRFLFGTLFLELVGYGFAGIALLLLNNLFILFLLSKLKKLWVEAEALEKRLKYDVEMVLAELEKDRETLLSRFRKATPGDAKKIEKEIKEIDKKIAQIKKMKRKRR